MQIYGPTAIFEPRVVPGIGIRWFPVNPKAKQFCRYANRGYETDDKLDELEDLGIHVERVNLTSVAPSTMDYDAIVDHTIRSMAAYRRKGHVSPKHIKDLA